MIASHLKKRDNDQQKHWVQWGTQHFQTHPHVSYWRHLTYDCRLGMGGRTVAAKHFLAAITDITGGGPARSLEVPPEDAAANDQVGV